MSKITSEKKQLIDVLKQYHDNRFTPGVYEHSIFGKAALLLERSEEVVRCKDCRWRKQGKLCYMISGCGEPVGTGDNFFCSYGERRTEK